MSCAGSPSSVLGRVLVVLPTYAERESLPGVLARIRRATPQVDVLVVDDASPDGTGELADRLAADDDRVHVLHRPAKQGLGAAYLGGFAWALAEGYDVVGEMDADGSHQPEELPGLLRALESADLVIGSRWAPGGTVADWSRRRQWLSRGGNAYTRLLLGAPVRDMTSGYRVFRRTTLEKIALDDVASLGYVFQCDLAHRTLQAGLRVTEVPIRFVERARGESKMTADVAAESLVRITRWGLSDRLHRVGKHPGLSGR
ncbi:MAG: polyprenol monophosphomannose synthase [Marmoricola sp.]